MSDSVKRALVLAVSIGAAVGLIVLCCGGLVGAFEPARPPVVIPTTYGYPSDEQGAMP